MHMQTVPKNEAWRGRGRPRREIPPEIRAAADRTYRTGHVQVVTITADEEEELRELLSLLNSYATSLGRRIRHQRVGDEVRFEMVDVVKRKRAAA